jgi:hypothetical protein
MAKRKGGSSTGKARSTKKSVSSRSSGKRQSPTSRPVPARATSKTGGRKTPAALARKASGTAKKRTAPRKAGTTRSVAPAAPGKGRTRSTKPGPKKAARPAARKPAAAQTPRLAFDRRRRPDETVPTPPSSLDMNRRGTAARSGRAEIAEALADHASMSPAITGGDVDADVENAYFSGDEAPGGDNPTPDQDIVDDIGKALGVEYQDNEELRASDKVADRDKKRWELDPASAEDYRDRDKEQDRK